MGWQEETTLPYVKFYYDEPELCKSYIADAQVVLFGGSDEESYIVERLQAKKPVVRYSERLYKSGQWKAISPRGLLKSIRIIQNIANKMCICFVQGLMWHLIFLL